MTKIKIVLCRMHSGKQSLICRSLKLAAFVYLFLTAALSPLGVALPTALHLLTGDYRVVERVVDGDTLLMEKGERVRLIGVDSPETKHFKKHIELRQRGCCI
jgi:endonuclease YncB( thermonuclease family)